MPIPASMSSVDRAFVINLDRRSDRLEAFCKKIPFSTAEITRFCAVDGEQLEPSGEIAELFAGNLFQYRRGVLGCALSHYTLWQRVAGAEEPRQNAVIFEDDVVFSEHFLTLWNQQISPFLPAGFDILYLGGPALHEETVILLAEHRGGLPKDCNGYIYGLLEKHRGNLHMDPGSYAEEMVGPHLAIPKRTVFGTFSYVVSKTGAARLCRIAQRDGIRRAVDNFLVDHWDELRVYATVPFLCWGVLNDRSDIQFDFSTLF